MIYSKDTSLPAEICPLDYSVKFAIWFTFLAVTFEPLKVESSSCTSWNHKEIVLQEEAIAFINDDSFKIYEPAHKNFA